MLSRTQRLFASALLYFLSFAANLDAATAPDLRIEAPDSLSRVVTRLEGMEADRLDALLELVGLEDGGPPIRVVLETEESAAAEAAPSWVAGYAYGALGTIVLFPARAPAYPDGSLEDVLVHEVVHVLNARAAGFHDLPRWFNEGIALAAAGSWSLDDRGWLTLTAIIDPDTPLGDVERMFAAGHARSSRAYALSGAFVRDLLLRKGPETVARILRLRALGLSFDEAFERTVGASPDRALEAFWRRYSLWYRWLPLLTSSFALWLGITALALAAALRKRRQRARLEAAWEEEEKELEEETPLIN